jgi:hypothetical protein
MFSHLCKNQTTPIILHNEWCYPLSYDTLDFYAQLGGQLGDNNLDKLGGSMWLLDRHDTTKIGIKFGIDPCRIANDVVHLHNIEQ